MRERAERILVGIALAMLLIGASAITLTTPGYTRALMLRTGGPERAGLPRDLAIQIAEDVRHYVTGRAVAPLPETVGGRPAFDERTVSHLDDVRDVVAGARLATSLAAGALAIWLAWCLARRRGGALEAGLRTGSLVAGGVVVLAAVIGLLDFDRFFSGFHGLFFDSGTWVFGYDDLIIQLFPESFWAVTAVSWGALTLLGALALFGTSRLVRRSLTAPAERRA